MKNSFDKKNLKEINNWLKDNKKIALATVIHTWGSSPQPVGSRMIVNENGDFSGSISGIASITPVVYYRAATGGLT